MAKITLKILDDAAYTQASEFFLSTAAADMNASFYSFVYTSALRYLDTGDAGILNSTIRAARVMNRVRLTTRLLKLAACHKVNDKGTFVGKVNKDKRTNLQGKAARLALRNRMETLIQKDDEYKAATAASPFDPVKATERFTSTVERLLSNGVDKAALLAILTEAEGKPSKGDDTEGAALAA